MAATKAAATKATATKAVATKAVATKAVATAKKPDIAKLKLDDFKTYVNGKFAVQIGIDKEKKPVSVTLKLDQAKSVGPEVKGGRPGGSFSLHFVGEETRLKQGIYPVTHAKLGTVEIFLVPAGPGPGGHGYHAVFG